MKKVYYKVVHPDFAERTFRTKKEAFDYRQDHINGLPNFLGMTKENKDYWEKEGKRMSVLKVTENTIKLI